MGCLQSAVKSEKLHFKPPLNFSKRKKKFFFEGVYGQLKRQPAQLVLICEVCTYVIYSKKESRRKDAHESIYIQGSTPRKEKENNNHTPLTG